MRYCEFCGTQLEDGQHCVCPEAREADRRFARKPVSFCEHCGKPLEFGQHCTCPEAREADRRSTRKPMSFCEYCGTPLEFGESCTCPEAREAERLALDAAAQRPILTQQQKEEVQQKMVDAQRKAKDAAMGLWGYLKSYFAAPAQAVRRNAREGLMISILLTVIRVLAAGLVVFGVLRNVCTAVTDSLSFSIEMSIDAPLIGSLLYGGLTAVLGMALFIAALFVVVKSQGGQISLPGAWQASAGNGVLPTLMLLLAFLLTFVSLPLALACAMLSIVASLICGVLTVQFIHSKTSSGMLWLVFFVAVVVIILICRCTAPTLVFNAVRGITISHGDESVAIGEAIDQVKEYIGDELIQDTLVDIVNKILRSVSF